MLTMWHSHQHLLERGLHDLSLRFEVTQVHQFLHHLALVEQWNRTYNLTAVVDRRQMVIQHVLDSLALLPFISSGHWLDVGSGAGFPGVPLAIGAPECQWTLVDSRVKKIRFLQQVVAELALPNVQVVRARVEHHQPSPPVIGVVARAVGSWSKVIQLTQHLLPAGGRWLLSLGQAPPDLPGDPDTQLHPLQVPGMVKTRHVLELRSQGLRM